MPAASDGVPLPHTWRPLGVRLAATFFGLMLLILCLFAWFGFDQATRDKFSFLQRGTLVGLGLMAFACGHALARSRVVARADSLLVVNGYRRRRFEWAEVVAVQMLPGAPWAVLDLADGTTVPAMAIQGSDGDRARRAARELRALVDQAH
ncbi:PH domain-containing protein [Nocardioides sp. InS609-2]|uniref:PH domain-containing protein n=1 Tax=Nocardioides sp. InS609-2 TaxID=2760705 RepID=UPI0020BE381D|nr:PH domain-containing protein [Nocardioides sp. InS609-2]